MPPVTLGSKIYELRKKKKLTQVELAKRVGVSGGAISQFEKGANKPSFETVEKLSEALGFNLEMLYISAKDAPVSRSDWEMARLLLINSRAREKEYNSSSFDTEFRHKDRVEDYEGLAIFRPRDFIHFLSDPDKEIDTYTVDVLLIPGINYDGCIVLELQGASMAPRYPNQSRHVVRPVEEEHWQHATGVHAIWLKSRKLLTKRIKSNKQGVIVLTSDATGEESTIELSDIASLWKFGQAVHLPPEE